MKKIIPFIILCMMIPMALAELHVYSRGILDSNLGTFTQHSFVQFEDSTAVFTYGTLYRLKMYCEPLSSFNANNPDHVVIENNMTITKMKFNLLNGSSPYFVDETFTPDEGLTYMSDSFYENEDMTFQLVTRYNNSEEAVADSNCIFSVEFESMNCDDCGELQYEEVVQSIDNREETFDAVVSPIYFSLNEFVEINFTIWAIGSWVIKSFILIGAVVLIFFLIYWLFFFFKKIIKGGEN